MRFISVLYIFVLSISCSTSIVSKDSQKKRANVGITVKRTKRNSWLVHYKLPTPVKGVVFHRQTNQFRKNEWKILTPGLAFATIEKNESIYSPKGESFTEITVEFPSYYKHTPKDYEFFQPYSDGGILFYTGHLYLHPLQKVTLKSDNKFGFTFDEKKRWTPNLELYSFDSGNVVIQGKVNSGKVDWVDKSIRGTYVYFGNINPVTTKTMVAVLDSGTPKWITDTMRDFLPKLFLLYWKKTKQKLSFRPVVYFNYKATTMSGTSNSGGTLPGLVQLTVEGTDWAKKDQGNLEHIVWFLAHEAAHFWNGQMFNNIDDDAAWLHEGGADAFAYRSLYELGIIDKKSLWEKHNNALNVCILGLGENALNNSSKNRKFKNYYHCGSIIMFFVESALSKQAKDLFYFWEMLLEKSQASKNEYGRKDFHELLRDEFGEKKLSVLIEEMELKGHQNLGQFLSKLAITAGIKLEPKNKNASAKFLFKMKMKMLSNIMKADCNGRVDISGRAKGFLIGGKNECKTFKPGKYDAVGVGGVKFRKTGYKPLYLAKKECREKGYMQLNIYNQKKPLKVPCEESHVEVFDWLELKKVKGSKL